ncbi:hypothetical protein BASA83_009452 [Batrachochytrium salamandrivorans]|nr:hypothetical protein BASA83_009452 [Batrachochytrium salamandrivorans]
MVGSARTPREINGQRNAASDIILNIRRIPQWENWSKTQSAASKMSRSLADGQSINMTPRHVWRAGSRGSITDRAISTSKAIVQEDNSPNIQRRKESLNRAIIAIGKKESTVSAPATYHTNVYCLNPLKKSLKSNGSAGLTSASAPVAIKKEIHIPSSGLENLSKKYYTPSISPDTMYTPSQVYHPSISKVPETPHVAQAPSISVAASDLTHDQDAASRHLKTVSNIKKSDTRSVAESVLLTSSTQVKRKSKTGGEKNIPDLAENSMTHSLVHPVLLPGLASITTSIPPQPKEGNSVAGTGLAESIKKEIQHSQDRIVAVYPEKDISTVAHHPVVSRHTSSSRLTDDRRISTRSPTTKQDHLIQTNQKGLISRQVGDVKPKKDKPYILASTKFLDPADIMESVSKSGSIDTNTNTDLSDELLSIHTNGEYSFDQNEITPIQTSVDNHYIGSDSNQVKDATNDHVVEVDVKDKELFLSSAVETIQQSVTRRSSVVTLQRLALLKTMTLSRENSVTSRTGTDIFEPGDKNNPCAIDHLELIQENILTPGDDSKHQHDAPLILNRDPLDASLIPTVNISKASENKQEEIPQRQKVNPFTVLTEPQFNSLTNSTGAFRSPSNAYERFLMGGRNVRIGARRALAAALQATDAGHMDEILIGKNTTRSHPLSRNPQSIDRLRKSYKSKLKQNMTEKVQAMEETRIYIITHMSALNNYRKTMFDLKHENQRLKEEYETVVTNINNRVSSTLLKNEESDSIIKNLQKEHITKRKKLAKAFSVFIHSNAEAVRLLENKLQATKSMYDSQVQELIDLQEFKTMTFLDPEVIAKRIVAEYEHKEQLLLEHQRIEKQFGERFAMEEKEADQTVIDRIIEIIDGEKTQLSSFIRKAIATARRKNQRLKTEIQIQQKYHAQFAEDIKLAEEVRAQLILDLEKHKDDRRKVLDRKTRMPAPCYSIA